MSINRSLAVTLISAGLCFAAGLALAKISAGGEGRVRAGGGLGGDSASGRSPRRLTALAPGAAASNRSASQFAALARSTEFGMYERMCGYFRLISEAEPGEMSELLATVQREVSDDMGGDLLVLALGARWADQDPVGAYQALLAGKTPGLDRSMGAILGAMVKADPSGAWQMMIKADRGSAGFLANAETRDRFISELVSAIWAEDANLAAELTTSAENPGAFQLATSVSLQAFAEADPRGFLDQLGQLRFASAGARSGAIESAFKRLATADIEAARARLDGIDGSARSQAELGLARAWSRSDPEAALAWADDLSGATRAQAQSEIIRQLAHRDPVAAAREVGTLESPQLRQDLAAQIADAWGAQDLDAAVRWVRGELEGKARERSYAELLRNRLQAADFEQDFAVLKEMADGSPEAGWGHYQFAQQWAVMDPQAAAEWSLARPNNGGEIFGQVVERWAQSDPDALRRFSATLEDAALREVVDEQLRQRGALPNGGEGAP